MDQAKVRRLDLSAREATVLAAALRATLDEIDEWEYQTRMVLDREDAEALIEQLALQEGVNRLTFDTDDLVLAMAAQALNEVLRGFRPPDRDAIGRHDELLRLEAHLEELDRA